MIVRDAALLVNGVPPDDMLRSVVKEFSNDLKRMKRLRSYYDGKHDITFRPKQSGDANNKLSHDYPGYIVSMASGYLAGNAISYASADQENAIAALLEAYKRVSIDSVDSELATDASIYGKGVEIIYAGRDSMPHAATLDPQCAFVVYDDTVEHAPLFGVHWYDHLNAAGTKDGIRANVYTAAAHYTYAGMDIERLSLTGAAKIHRFGDVPLIEYWNNAGERGDFERVISLIDAYDILESDRVNDTQQFVDSIMAFYGVSGLDTSSTPDDTRTAEQRLREDRALFLPPPDRAKFEWATKQLNHEQVEVLKKALNSDIHKFSLVPDLTDQEFAGNSSGVAMKYKLLGLEQLTKVKERWFREGLRWRLRLFARFLAIKGNAPLDPETVTMTFTRSLPVNDLEIAQTVNLLQGTVPDKMLLAQIPWVSDVAEALNLIAAQKEEEIKRPQKAFGGTTSFTGEQDTGDNDTGTDDDA